MEKTKGQEPVANLELSLDYSTIQHENEDIDGDINHLLDSSIDLCELQNLSSSTGLGVGGKGRLDSLRQNLTKQQERLTALRERALRKSESDGQRKTSLSHSMESLKHLGKKLQKLKTRGIVAENSSTPLTITLKDDIKESPLDGSSQQLEVVSGCGNGSGSEKLLMLTQRTEQTRALLEQRKRDLAKSLLCIKALPNSSNTELELGSSMTDLRNLDANPVSRHRSAADLQNPQPDQQLEESRLKFLKNKMKLTELKKNRQDQELQEIRQELHRRGELIDHLEIKEKEMRQEVERLKLKEGEAAAISQCLQDQERNRLQTEIGPLRQRLNELETINDILETTRGELQKDLTLCREQLQQQRGKDSTDSQVNVELAKQLQELQQQFNHIQKENEKLSQQSKLQVDDSNISGRLSDMETQIQLQRNQLEEQKLLIDTQKDELDEKSTELNVLNVNLRLLEEKLSKAQSTSTKSIFLVEDKEKGEGEEEMQQLKQKLDESNKINIKLKLKCKQSEKKLEKLQQFQDITQIAAENERLQQRICVLEDEKGQWQLKAISEGDDNKEDKTELKPLQLEAIRLLEEQKAELQQALEALQQGNSETETARVQTELSEIQLEEQLNQRVEQLEQDAQEQNYQLQTLQREKEELEKKLSHYVNENMELLDKLEKLSSSASSAESIEIVERPLPAEQELETSGDCYDRPTSEEDAEDINNPLRKFVSEPTQTDLSPEQEELEFFATERHEVLQKLEHLMDENGQLQSKLEKEQREKDSLAQQLMEKSSNSSNLSQELSSMQRSSEVMAALDVGNGGADLVEKCQRSLNKLHSELEAYGKAHDRNAKLNAVKKLAREAGEVYVQLSELLQKVKEASTAVETVTVVETVVAVTAPNGKALAEYEQLTAQNSQLKEEINRLSRALEEQQPPLEALAGQQQEEMNQELEVEISQLRRVIDDLRLGESEHLQLLASQSAQIAQLQLQTEQFDHLLNSKEMNHEKQMEQQSRLRHELESRQESLDAELIVLQTLVAEQKRQLIENLGESEHKMNLKCLEIQSLQEELRQLMIAHKEEQNQLRISKSLVAQQIGEISSKAETIDMLSQEINKLQQTINESKVAEQAKIKDLKEKLKKYALNLKKRNQDYTILEEKLKELSEPKKECSESNRQLEQLHLQNQKLHDELKVKIHLNLEQRDTVRQLKQQMVEQEQEQQRLQVELQNVIQANTDLRLEQMEWEKEMSSKQKLEQLRLDQEQLIKDLHHQLEQKTLKFDKSKEVIKHRNASIQSLQRQIQELNCHKAKEEVSQDKEEELASCRAQLEDEKEKRSNDKKDFEETIVRLETLCEGIQAKLQQNESYTESLEVQNTEIQKKYAALEDRSAIVIVELSEAKDFIQMLEKNLKEVSNERNNLEQQLNKQLHDLNEHKQVQTTQLSNMHLEAESNRQQVNHLQAAIETLQSEQQNFIDQTKSQQDYLEEISKQHSDQVADLQHQLSNRESELQRQRQVHDAKLAAKTTELDEMECDLNAHIERSTAEIRDLHQQKERHQEEMSEVERERASLSRDVMRLRLQLDSSEQDSLELQELRMQVMQDKNEIDHLRSQIDSLCVNHTQELQLMQQRIAEMDTLGQNQTDDQMFLETENKRLMEQVTEMQGRLHGLSEELLSQQSVVAVAPVFDSAPAPAPSLFFATDDSNLVPTPFDIIVAEPLIVRETNQQIATNSTNLALPLLPPTIEDLQRNVSDLEKYAQDLESKLLTRNQSLSEQEKRLLDLEQLLSQKDYELNQLKETQRLNELEKLIIPQETDSVIVATSSAPPTTLDMFFKDSDTRMVNLPKEDLQSEGVTSSIAVNEPLIEPKRAYLCHPEEQISHMDLTLGCDEDPWALASDQVVNASERTDPALLSRVYQLEQQLAKVEQEKIEANTKTAKLMKRLKEYKNKLQSTSAITQDNDLDIAIIDELKHQLHLQELNQTKNTEQIQQLALEKEKLTKRIDVLTAGNERMAELKERQDMDVQMYQARIRELQDKLQQMDNWESSPALLPEVEIETKKKLENLQAENLDLNNECQDLQCQRDDLLQKVQQLEEKIDDYEMKTEKQDQQLTNSNISEERHTDQIALLQERESEIYHLKQRIEDLMREDQTEKLVFEILTKNQEVQALRMQIKQLEEDNQQENSNLEIPLHQSEAELEKLLSENANLAREKAEMEEELHVLNNHVLSTLEMEDRMKRTVLELDTKNIEITELRKSLELIHNQKQPQHASQSDTEHQVAILNQQWEAVVEQKCNEVATIWQNHLSEREETFKQQLEQLRQKQQVPPIQVAEDYNEVLLKMQKALENQEMEIVTLKEQLAIRSAEYARLAAQYDPFRLQNRQEGGEGLDVPKSSKDPLPEYVLKADLDYALMMLHQRDMRVEEMIVELVQLLEERDHLQLKLSDTLRQLETERSYRQPTNDLTAAPSNISHASPLKAVRDTSTDLSTAVGSLSGSATISSSISSDLEQKLAELQTVKHSKDKAIVEEREQRLQQMIQLQKDMAKQVPSTASLTSSFPTEEKPMGVDLSQPSLRSPSMVLMDWLMGNKKNEEEGEHKPTTGSQP